MISKERCIWISWEKHIRNIGLSSALDVPLYEIIYNNKSALLRYTMCLFRTVLIIIKKKPIIIIAQNPSILLATFTVFFKRIIGSYVIIDAHNCGIFPLEGKVKFFVFWAAMLQKYADLTIVSNENLRSIVESNGGKALVLPDKIPVFKNKKTTFSHLCGGKNIAFICSFNEDEPYNEVFKAAELLPDNIYIYVTGKYKGKVTNSHLPNNLKLLGYISDDEYWALLSSVDIVMDLTLRDNCLVCGAYESIAVKKPLILSNTNALRSYFYKGCVYVSSNAISIAEGVICAIKNKNDLQKNIEELGDELRANWEINLSELKEIINAYYLKYTE